MEMASSVPMTIAVPADEDARQLRAFVERGDREAFADLLRRHLGSCWRLALRLSGNAADAEDVLQEATLIAMRHAPRWRGGSVRAWLLGIVANAQRDLARAARRRQRRERESAPPPPEPVADAELREAAVAALAELPEAYRAPVCLRYLEDLDFPGIAAALGLRERTARTRVSRGLERLRELLAPRRTGLSAAACVALAATAPTPPPPATLSAAVLKVASSATLAPASATAATTAVVGVIVAALLAVLGVIWTRPWRHAMAGLPNTPATHALAGGAGDAGDAGDARGALDRALDLRLDLALYHQFDPILAIRSLLPPGTAIPYAFPFSDDRLPWTGATVVAQGMRVRDYIDSACTQLELMWEVDDGYVLFFHAMQSADRAADLASLRDEKSTGLQRREAAGRLAWSRDKDALRALLLGAFGPDERIAAAAGTALLEAYGTPWPTSRRGTVYHAFRGDREVVGAAAAALSRANGSVAPLLLYWCGVLKAPGAGAALEAAGAKDFCARPASRASAHLSAMRAATAVASAEVGAAWDADPWTATIAAQDAPTVRIACAHAWARRGDARAVPALVAAWKLTGLDWDLAALLGGATVEARARCPGGADVVAALLAALAEGGDEPRSSAAAHALAEMRDASAQAPLARLMAMDAQPAPTVRQVWALDALLWSRRAEARGPLRDLAASPSPAVRALALGALLADGDRTALDPLAAIAEAEPEIPASHAAAVMLAWAGTPEAVERLAVLARTRDTALNIIAEALAPRAVEALIAVLNDHAQPLARRLGAAQQLGHTHAMEAATALGRAALEVGDDDGLRHACVDHLVSMHCPSAHFLIQALGSFAAADMARLFEANYLSFPSRVRATERSVQLAAAPDAWRAQAYAALGDLYLDDPSLPVDAVLVQLRRALIEDRVGAVRKTAAEQLANLARPDDRDTIAALGRACRGDADDGVRGMARRALENARRGIERRGRVDALRLGGGIPDLSALADIARELEPAQSPATKGKADF